MAPLLRALFFERYALVVGPVGTEPLTAPDGDIESVERTTEVIHAYRLTVAVNVLGLPSAVVSVGVDGACLRWCSSSARRSPR